MWHTSYKLIDLEYYYSSGCHNSVVAIASIAMQEISYHVALSLASERRHTAGYKVS